MSIEVLRDLAIVIACLILILAAAFTVVIVFLLYRGVNQVLKSAKHISREVEELTTVATDEVGKPLLQVARIIQVTATLFSGIRSLLQRRGKEK